MAPTPLELRLQTPSRRSEIVGCGYLDKAKGTGTWDRDLGAHALVYLLDGGGYYRDDTTPERRIGAGDVLVLFPGKPHSYYSGDQPLWVEVWLVFRGGVFQQLEHEGVLDRDRPVVHPGLDQRLMDGFDSIHAGFGSGDVRDSPSLVARAHLLCAEVMRLDRAQRPEAGLVAQACARLADALDRPLDLERVAKGLGMGYERFRKFFAREMGMPPARYRQLKRIERARQMLTEDGAPLATIAERLGYCDEYFFNRQFKLVTGLSPARYRRDFS